MKILFGGKDGGPESRVYVYGLEIKSLFSVLLLRFDEGSREAFHTHAFSAISWLIKGQLWEKLPHDGLPRWVVYKPSIRAIHTPRERMHQVLGIAPSNWVLTLRGPWKNTWRDISARGDFTLTHGRKVVS
jgi:hypothetical protein